jgi:urease accessory protein
MSLATLLLLGDARLPSGAHAHSGGLEAAVSAGRVHDLPTLESFLRGRLATAGMVAAAFTAAACARPHELAELDAGLDARTPSSAARRASRAQGRALARAGRAIWPLPPRLDPAGTGPHHAVALGAVAAAAGLPPGHAALLAAYGSVTGPASAAIRLLGLDPYPVHALLAALAVHCEQTAERAAALADRPVDELPAMSAPLLDITAEQHATWEVRLFAS